MTHESSSSSYDTCFVPCLQTHVSSSSSYDTLSSSSSNDKCFVPCVQTIEEIKGHRQKEILAMLPYLKGMYACMSVYLYIYIDT